jgi:hypothetical protein
MVPLKQDLRLVPEQNQILSFLMLMAMIAMVSTLKMILKLETLLVLKS